MFQPIWQSSSVKFLFWGNCCAHLLSFCLILEVPCICCCICNMCQNLIVFLEYTVLYLWTLCTYLQVMCLVLVLPVCDCAYLLSWNDSFFYRMCIIFWRVLLVASQMLDYSRAIHSNVFFFFLVTFNSYQSLVFTILLRNFNGLCASIWHNCNVTR
jgi:hypothetical protein